MIRAPHILELKGKDIWTITPEDSVYNALRLMARVDIGAVLVMENEELIGILSERDYARKVILFGKTSKETKVSEIMTTDLVTVHPMETLEECMDKLSKYQVRHLPVVDEGKVIGVISIGDVVNLIIHKQRKMIKDLTAKIPGNIAV